MTCPPECPHPHLYLCPWQSPCPSQTRPTWHWPRPRWPGERCQWSLAARWCGSWPERRSSCGRSSCCSPRCSPLSQSWDSSMMLTRSSCSSTSSLPTAHGRVKFRPGGASQCRVFYQWGLLCLFKKKDILRLFAPPPQPPPRCIILLNQPIGHYSLDGAIFLHCRLHCTLHNVL